MLEIGEIVGLLETKVNDKSKKVNCTISCIRMNTISVTFDKESNKTVIVSNNETHNTKSVNSLIFDLQSYQSTEKVEFLFFDTDGTEFIRINVSTFNDIDIIEYPDFVDIVLKPEKEDVK